MLSLSLIETAHRRASAAALFAGVAISAMGYTMMVAFLPLAAEDLLGSPRWSGVPSALGTMGTALGTTWLSWIMARRGRRRGLVSGYGGAALSAAVAALAAAIGVFSLLACAIFFLGAGYAASRLSRYAAAELYDPQKRSAAIGWNVWAATVGSVAGPLLLSTTRKASQTLQVPEAMGPFLMAALAFAVSGLVLRLLFPAGGPMESTRAEAAEGVAPVSPAGVQLALVSLVVGQVVMVLIMTMTPVHIRHGGEDLSAVGVVIASHTFGMYALSPVAGLLSDRLGRVPMIAVASLLTVLSGLLAANSPPGSFSLAFALFLLGLGWCLSFVAASALLTESTPGSNRVRLQGLADSLVWGSAAVAGLSSGYLIAEVGYAALSHLGALLAAAPLLFLIWLTFSLRSAPLSS